MAGAIKVAPQLENGLKYAVDLVKYVATAHRVLTFVTLFFRFSGLAPQKNPISHLSLLLALSAVPHK